MNNAPVSINQAKKLNQAESQMLLERIEQKSSMWVKQFQSGVSIETIASINKVGKEIVREVLANAGVLEKELKEEIDPSVLAEEAWKERVETPEKEEPKDEETKPVVEESNENQMRPHPNGTHVIKPDGHAVFRKGVSGNPQGKPAGTISLLTDIKQRLVELKEKSPREYEELLDSYWKSSKHKELLLQMIDGRPRQQVSLGGEGGNPIIIRTTTYGHHDKCQCPDCINNGQ